MSMVEQPCRLTGGLIVVRNDILGANDARFVVQKIEAVRGHIQPLEAAVSARELNRRLGNLAIASDYPRFAHGPMIDIKWKVADHLPIARSRRKRQVNVLPHPRYAIVSTTDLPTIAIDLGRASLDRVRVLVHKAYIWLIILPGVR